MCPHATFRSGQTVSIARRASVEARPPGGIRLICNALRGGVKIRLWEQGEKA